MFAFILFIPNIIFSDGEVKINFKKRNKPAVIIIYIILFGSTAVKFFIGNHNSGTYLENTINNFSTFLIFMMLFSMIAIGVMSVDFFKKIQGNPKIYLGLFFFSIIFNLIALGSGQALTVMSTKGLGPDYSFKYQNTIVKTDSTIRFVGQTKSAMFLYNTKNNTTTIYKTENIDSLIIKP
ncbi:hypothetical protein GCM10027043_50450 [Ferruginibacter profundus]